jgi:glycosyltransferase involved in cell wall biosynthesis
MSFGGRVEKPARPVVIVSANGAWFIVNFCGGLIRGLQKAGYEVLVVAPSDPALESRIRKLGVEHVDVRLERSGVNPFADLRLLAAYRRLLKSVRPVAYLGYTIKPNIYGSIAASSLGIPAIPNVSGLGTAFIRPGLLQWIVTRLYRYAFRRVPAVHFQNPDDRQLFLSRRIIDHEHTRLVPGSGIDLNRFRPAPVRKDPPVFLLVGRLLRDKGILEYVQAARLLRDELPGARFQLLGPMDEGNRTAIRKPELEAWVRDGLIEYLGATDDVRPFIAAASAVVLPSYREGLPRSLVEAAAMARPLIATDVPGCREVVEDGVNGFLCSPANPASLAGAMRKFAELPDESRNAMGEASRRKVQDRFSDQIVVRTYLEGLKRLPDSQP